MSEKLMKLVDGKLEPLTQAEIAQREIDAMVPDATAPGQELPKPEREPAPPKPKEEPDAKRRA